MAIYDELEELVGRLTALKINYPDFSIRVDPSVDLYSKVLGGNLTPQLLHYIGNDMAELLNYLTDVYNNVQEVRNELKPIIRLLQSLTEPV